MVYDKNWKIFNLETKIHLENEKVRGPYAKNNENPCPERLSKSEIRAKNNVKSEIRG